MAKLNKQKFNLAGYYNEDRTTYRGDIELNLYYETEHEYFYFDKIEMEKYLRPEDVPHVNAYFGQCDTKSKAIDAMQAIIVKGGKETKYLRILLRMPSSLYQVPNPNNTSEYEYKRYMTDPKFPKYLAEMLDGISFNEIQTSGLSLGYERVIKLEVNNLSHYVACDENWKYNSKSLHGRGGNLIEWTEEREKFLIDTQDKLNKLCQVVLDYFNAGEDISSLFKRMESGSGFLKLNK